VDMAKDKNGRKRGGSDNGAPTGASG